MVIKLISLHIFFCETMINIICVCIYRSDGTPEAYFQCSIIFTLLGAWLGAFPIPLDWDRPWQVRLGEDWGYLF